MLNVEQIILFFSEHDVLCEMKAVFSAICGIVCCTVRVTWTVCVKNGIESEVTDILEIKGFQTRNRTAFLQHTQKNTFSIHQKEQREVNQCCSSVGHQQALLSRGMVDVFQMTLTRLCSDLKYTVLEISWLSPKLLVMAACMQQTQHVANDR